MFIGYVLLAIALAELYLGLYFIFRYVRRQATVWYGLFCVGAAVYVGANGIGYLTNSFFFGERVSWIGGFLATIFFLAFSRVFPLPRTTISGQLGWVIWPIALFVPGLLFTNAFIDDLGITRFREGYQTATGELFWLMMTAFVAYWAWSIINLMRSRAVSGGIHRRQLNVLLGGTMVSLTVAIALDIVLPLTTTSRLGYVGSLVTSVWLGATSWIIRKQ